MNGLMPVGVVVLVLVGIYGALSNLPVVSGCAFYGNCPIGSTATQPVNARLERR
jgi:hypothetical protein